VRNIDSRMFISVLNPFHLYPSLGKVEPKIAMLLPFIKGYFGYGLKYHIILMDILYELGGYGPILLVFLSWYVLFNHKNLLFYFNIGLFANTILNLILKGIIQEPRPMFDSKKIKLMASHAKDYFFQNGIPFDFYGMPSGHAQTSFYITIFIYLSLKHTNLLYLCIFFSLLICYQRVKYNYHSISQVLVGSVIGAVFAYLVYQQAREKIKGRIREREDDHGPI
jgi:membrane-associated phospholipid phosphatase